MFFYLNFWKDEAAFLLSVEQLCACKRKSVWMFACDHNKNLLLLGCNMLLSMSLELLFAVMSADSEGSKVLN